MTLTAGSRLGPYEILAPIGAGGMGEVYRAKDPRLGREVAIKVLPASFSADADRLRRFEQEARAAGILNHPNITAIYDIGSHEGAPYVVQELLEGETLRSLLAGGRLSPRKAIDTSLQIAHGLAAAHEKGIVHRDLKPENLFVTRDGRVKILDFGLAKLTLKETGPEVTSLPTATAGTEPGVVLGTLGYMSPEQVRGRPADARSDIFSFGAILYEMLSGNRAFRGDSAADTMSAILKEDPPELSVTNQNISPGLERIVRHCLEKNPEQRFHSAHDVAFALEALSGSSGPSGIVPALRARSRKRVAVAAGTAIGLGLLLLAFAAGQRTGPGSAGSGSEKTPVIHRRLTFRRGNVLFARFAPDGQNVVFSASWGDRPAEIFLSRIGSPESRPLGIPSASLLSVSPAGELAILLKKANVFGTYGGGTLARVALAGGAPKEVLEGVLAADWSPDGASLAVVRERGGKAVLEFPIGKEIYSTAHDGTPVLRIAPDGKHIALVDGSSVVLISLDGKRQVLSKDWLYIDSLAWNPGGGEIWFIAIDPSTGAGLRAVDLSGKTRTIVTTTDLEVLHDVFRDGKALVEREIATREILFSSGGAPERDLSWLDQSNVNALSPDGRMLLLTESGEGGGERGSVYLRSTDGSPAVRVGDGRGLDLSSDGKRVLALVPSAGGDRLTILPTGPGEPQALDVGTLAVNGGVFVPPDGRRIAIGAREAGRPSRAYLLEPGAAPRAFTPEGLTGSAAAFSPDGRYFAANGPDEKPVLYPLSGGEPKPLPGLESGDNPIQWSADGESLYVTRFGEVPLRVFRYRLSAGKKELWKALVPAERTGLVRIESVVVTPDGKSYAYSNNRVTASDLYVVSGWK